ncbi:MAG: copper resistance protein B [Deltaproteobacteria bacterium]|nr:copper resistance protein B [Deltaproteobacteria bacterium]
MKPLPLVCTVCLSWAALLLASARASENDLGKPVHDDEVHVFLLSEVLEYRRTTEGGESAAWDVVGWIGGDYNRVWVKSEGEGELGSRASGTFDAQILYGRLIAPYWDLQIGFRQEWKYGPGKDRTRTSVVFGVQGLTPYRFELEPSLFISEEGDISARITADYDLLLTQRLILQPRIETELALQKVEEFGVGRGIHHVEMGLRLRHELHRKFAPYFGMAWRRDVGGTAALARKEGREVEDLSLAAGVRMWF